MFPPSFQPDYGYSLNDRRLDELKPPRAGEEPVKMKRSEGNDDDNCDAEARPPGMPC